MRPVPANSTRRPRVPHPRTRRALIIVDVERRFVTGANEHIVPRIARLVREGRYAHVVVAEHTRGRLSARPLARRGDGARSDETVTGIATLLDPERTSIVPKSTRSAFGNGAELVTGLRRRRIPEVHITGIETHDCVLATAIDAFDHGFVTCVIENACASKRARDHENGLRVLRRLHLTDTSIRF